MSATRRVSRQTHLTGPANAAPGHPDMPFVSQSSIGVCDFAHRATNAAGPPWAGLGERGSMRVPEGAQRPLHSVILRG